MANVDKVAAARLAALNVRANDDRAGFFFDLAGRLDWIEPPTATENVSFGEQDFHIRWYADGVLNASINALDRHLDARGDATAILFEPDDPSGEFETISFRELHRRVCQLGNALRALGVARGDVVAIYMPMIPDAAVAMLACARIGAVHNVVFGGFSAAALAGRIGDSRAKLVITADEGRRGGKPISLKRTVDAALASTQATSVETVLVVRHTGAAVPMQMPRDRWFDVVVDHQPDACEPEAMGAEDPLFILYTSGSTGQPKGLVHTTGGYLAWAAFTHELAFDVAPGHIWWCTADVGWITGHSYVVYGPLANGVTTLMFEGVPTWPDAGRFWQVVDRHAVTHFYTAPTAIRALMRDGDAPVTGTSRASLKVLGTVGEPINPEAFRWYDEVIGEGRCPVVDTWWQTETGGILIAPCAGTIEPKPGAAMQPLPGIQPALLDSQGATIDGPGAGHLVLERSWPGQARTIHGDPQRFFETYFRQYPGRYFTGDGARRDADGDLWITGRVDDVINVSGHRIGTAEVESSLVAHPSVAEAAVVGMPHDLKGQGIYAFVTPMAGIDGDEALRSALIAAVRSAIGPIATPDVIQFAAALPKTRSGKIMRRILRKIAAGEVDGFGDTSTLADPAVVETLARDRPTPKPSD